jgi:hypothetical protein
MIMRFLEAGSLDDDLNFKIDLISTDIFFKFLAIPISHLLKNRRITSSQNLIHRIAFFTYTFEK